MSSSFAECGHDVPIFLLFAALLLVGGFAVALKVNGKPTDGTEVPFPLVVGVLMKPGVKFDGIKPQAVQAIRTSAGVFLRHGVGPLVITSIEDGTHVANSLHYKGLAVDMRTRHLPLESSKVVAADIRAELGKNYDVLNEGIGPGYDRQAAAHIHVEYDPKK